MNERLELRYVPLSTLRRWDKNPKPHDMGTLIESMRRYGFKDPPKYEPALNRGDGGIVEGNGRWEALTRMRDDGDSPPRGIEVTSDDWLVPVLFGIDAQAEAEAEAYAIDHNAITVMGGNAGPGWPKMLYLEDDLSPVLQELRDIGSLPLTIDLEDANAILDPFREDESPPAQNTCPKCGFIWGK